MASSENLEIQVARGTGFLAMRGLFSNLAGLVYFIIATRVLTREEMGSITSLFVYANFFSFLLAFALPQTVTRFVAEFEGSRRFGAIKLLFRKTVPMVFVFSAIIALSFLLIGLRFFKTLFGVNDILPVVFASGFAAVSLLSQYFLAFLLGLRFYGLYALYTLIGATLTAVFRVGFLWGRVAGVMLGFLLGAFVTFILAFKKVRVLFSDLPLGDTNFSVRSLFTFALPLYLSNIVVFLRTNLDKILIQWLMGFRALGVYSVVIALLQAITVFATAVNQAIYPAMSSIYGKGGKGSLGEAFKKSSRYIYLVFTPLAFGLAALASPVVFLFAGPLYEEGAVILAIASLTWGCFSLIIPASSSLLALGKSRYVLYASITGVIGEFLTGILLIRWLGYLGVGLTIFSSTFFLLVTLLYFSRREKIFNVELRDILFPLIGSITMFFTVFSLGFVLGRILWVVIGIPLGAAIYIIMLRIFRIVRREDLVLAEKLLPPGIKSLITIAEKVLLNETKRPLR